MATQPIAKSSTSPPSALTISVTLNYTRPLAIVTTLFFMWGFLTCLNDILVPHLKSIFDLSYARVMLIQFSFFSTYFLFSVPWSKIVNAIGYQKSMVAGLFCMAVGAFLFLPAASSASMVKVAIQAQSEPSAIPRRCSPESIPLCVQPCTANL